MKAFVLTGVMIAALVQTTPPAQAQQSLHRADVAVSAATSSIVLETGAGRVIALGRAATSVFAADPKIAEVRPASATSLFIFGVGPGRTTVAALDQSGAPVAQYDVIVKPSSYSANEASSDIAQAIPGSHINVQTRAAGAALTGTVSSPGDAHAAMDSARMEFRTTQRLHNELGVGSSTQVNLHVRIAEMGRTLTRSLGIDWQAMGKVGQIGIAAVTQDMLGSLNIPASTATITKTGSFEAIIDALSQDQLIHVLAEPNLTAMSGETASFIVGGEFPIPVGQQNNEVTIDFKQYGISLAFVPTVLSDGEINLKVRPEVSELTTQGSVQLSAGNATLQIPALSVRRAETTVTLGSGQSFAIAGLLQDSITHTGNGVPFLGDVPVLGALFRSDTFQRQQTELVIVVTPYIVKPANSPAELQTATDGYQAPDDFERIILLRQTAGTGPNTKATTLPGSVGFLLQ